MSMEVKTCKNCQVTCWHNPSGKADTAPRCTFCGYPPGGSTDKKLVLSDIAKRQANRAQLLKITRAGVW